MNKRNFNNQRLIAVFLLGGMAFNYPLLSLFNTAHMVFGIPRLYLFIFLIWVALIGLTIIIVAKSS